MELIVHYSHLNGKFAVPWNGYRNICLVIVYHSYRKDLMILAITDLPLFNLV